MSTDNRPLAEIIKELLTKSSAPKESKAKAKTQKVVKPQPSLTEREERISRVLSQRWRDEQLILLVTRTRCECGELYTSPAPRMFIRRYHPQYGIHMEPLVVRPHSPMLSASPPIVEHIDEQATICHRCLPVRQAAAMAEAQQMSFDFVECILQNLPLLTEKEPMA